MRKISYSGYRFPPEIIHQAVWLYLRFTLMIQKVLQEAKIGELEQIKLLPGMVGAAAITLRKAWRSEVDLRTRAKDHPRIASVAALQ